MGLGANQLQFLAIELLLVVRLLIVNGSRVEEIVALQKIRSHHIIALRALGGGPFLSNFRFSAARTAKLDAATQLTFLFNGRFVSLDHVVGSLGGEIIAEKIVHIEIAIILIRTAAGQGIRLMHHAHGRWCNLQIGNRHK